MKHSEMLMKAREMVEHQNWRYTCVALEDAFGCNNRKVKQIQKYIGTLLGKDADLYCLEDWLEDNVPAYNRMKDKAEELSDKMWCARGEEWYGLNEKLVKHANNMAQAAKTVRLRWMDYMIEQYRSVGK